MQAVRWQNLLYMILSLMQVIISSINYSLHVQVYISMFYYAEYNVIYGTYTQQDYLYFCSIKLAQDDFDSQAF